MEKKRSMKQHVSFVGALHIGFGLLGLAGALAIFFGSQFLFEFVEDEPIAQDVLSFIGNSVALILVFFQLTWDYWRSRTVFLQTLGPHPGDDRFGH